MGHSVGKAAENATRKGMAKKAAEALTPEQVITQVRTLRTGKLFVSNMEFVDTLLSEYDAVLVAGKAQEAELIEIKAEAERFITRNNELMQTMLEMKHTQQELVRANAGLSESLAATNGELHKLKGLSEPAPEPVPPMWQPSTEYAVGDPVQQPDGEIKVISDHFDEPVQNAS